MVTEKLFSSGLKSNFIFTHIYGTGSNFLLFNTCAIKFIERNFILKEGHVILEK